MKVVCLKLNIVGLQSHQTQNPLSVGWWCHSGTGHWLVATAKVALLTMVC